MRAILTVLVATCLASAAHGELSLQVESPGPMVATLKTPPGGKVVWRVDEGLKFKGNDKCVGLWGLAGPHWVEADVTKETRQDINDFQPGPNWPDDPKDYKIAKVSVLIDRTTETFREEFTIEGGPGPGPKPLPPAKPGSLGSKVPEGARQELVDFYGSWVRTLRGTTQCKTTGEFQSAHANSMAAYQDIIGASGWAAINPPISQKLIGVLGTSDVALEGAKRTALAAALDEIATEFRGQ